MDKVTLERKGYSVAALREHARRRLPRALFDMVDGAAGDEVTMRLGGEPVAVTVTCADGTTAHGTGATWTLSETGILDCEARPTPKDDIPARVADQYCP